MQKIHTIWWLSVVQYIPCRHSLPISVCIYNRSLCLCHKLCYMDRTSWCSTGSQQLEWNQEISYLKGKRIFFGPAISESISFISITPSDSPLIVYQVTNLVCRCSFSTSLHIYSRNRRDIPCSTHSQVAFYLREVLCCRTSTSEGLGLQRRYSLGIFRCTW